MAGGGGLLFFANEANKLAQKFSVASEELAGAAGDVVSEGVDRALDRMRAIVLSGGINSTQKGGPRVQTGQMFNSIQGDVSVNGRDRVQGQFGFSEDTPSWTLYQEAGTSRVASMLAYATARQELITDLQNTFEQGKWLPHTLWY